MSSLLHPLKGWSLRQTRSGSKNKFSTVVDAALSGTPQEVTRRGKPAVVVLSATDYRQLFADRLLSFGPEEALIRGRLSDRIGLHGAGLQIAATALARGAIVVTSDVAHFEPMGVRIENPFTAPRLARNRQDRRARVRK